MLLNLPIMSQLLNGNKEKFFFGARIVVMVVKKICFLRLLRALLKLMWLECASKADLVSFYSLPILVEHHHRTEIRFLCALFLLNHAPHLNSYPPGHLDPALSFL